MKINKDRNWKNYRRAFPRLYIGHHQFNHVIPSFTLPLAVCILMLPMLMVAVEHLQLATTYHMNPIDRCSHMALCNTPVVLPSLNNVLTAMVLLNRGMKLNIGFLPRFSCRSNIPRVSPSLSLSVYYSLDSRVVREVVLILLLLSGDIEVNPGPLGECLD